jgi:hypothetical protein
VRLLDELLRVPYGAALTAAAVFFGWWAYEVFNNLWAEYRDGSDTTYLTVGGALLVLAATTSLAAWRALRDADHARQAASLALGFSSGSVVVALIGAA